jgi:ArsR family transcriptional regulator, virulence genes transcriptional regulator
MQEENQLEIYRLQADLCKALSDPKRLRIIRELRNQERTVSELVEILGLKQSNTSQHLGILRRIGLIVFRKTGSTVYYRLANPKIGEACDMVHQVIADQLQSTRDLAKVINR